MRSLRTPALDLDSVYGAGPEGQPALYERPEGTEPRLRLKVGETWGEPGVMDPHDHRGGLNMPGKVTQTRSGRLFVACQDLVAKAPPGST